MAKGDIELNLRTKYHGEGMKKLDESVRKASGKLKDCSNNVDGVTKALKGLGAEAGKAGQIVGGLKNMFNAFTQGGVIGVGIAAIGAGFSFIANKMSELKKEAQEFSEKIKDGMVSAIEKVKDKVDSLRDSFKRMREVAGQKNEQEDIKKDIILQDQISAISDKARKEREGMTKSYDKTYSKAQEQHDIAILTARRQLEQTHDNEVRQSDVVNEKQKQLDAIKNKQSKAKSAASRSDRDIGLEIINATYENGLQKSAQIKKFLEGDNEDIQKLVDEYKKKASETVAKLSKDVETATKELNDAKAEETKAHLKTTNEEKKYKESVKKADEALREAKEAREKAVADEKKAVDDKKKAEDKKIADQKKKAEDEATKKAEKAKEEQDKATKEQKKKELKDEEKAVKTQLQANLEDADNRLKERKAEADQWEKDASSARGVKFNDWMRQQKQKDKDKSNQDKLSKSVDSEIAILEKRVLGRDGAQRRTASKKDIERLNKLKEWKEFQDPNNNRAAKDAEQIEKEKIDLQKKAKEALEKIQDALVQGITP